MFSCENCNFFKNIYFEEHLGTTACGYQKVVRKTVACRCSVKKLFLKFHINSQENSNCNSIKKEIPTQVFSYEFCYVFFTEHVRWLVPSAPQKNPILKLQMYGSRVSMYVTTDTISFLPWSSCIRNTSLREKCPSTEIFWSIFFCIQTEYGDLKSKSLYYLDTFHAIPILLFFNSFSLKSLILILEVV